MTMQKLSTEEAKVIPGLPITPYFYEVGRFSEGPLVTPDKLRSPVPLRSGLPESHSLHHTFISNSLAPTSMSTLDGKSDCGLDTQWSD
jgi:hypothetical protein